MTDTKTLAVFFLTTVALAGGSAWAATEAAPKPSEQALAQKAFGQLSADGTRAYQDLTMARMAIYDGRIADAKTFASESRADFLKAKSDDSVFLKDEHQLMTSQQLAVKQKAKSGSDASANNASASTDAAPAGPSAKPIAWLPVDGAISLNEDYKLSPAKQKAVADANGSLAKGDRKAAIEKLKLADVDMAVVLQVVPVEKTVSDVSQAADLINAGKYYEGSQMLRQVQASARYDVTDVAAVPAAKASASSQPAAPAAKTGMPLND